MTAFWMSCCSTGYRRVAPSVRTSSPQSGDGEGTRDSCSARRYVNITSHRERCAGGSCGKRSRVSQTQYGRLACVCMPALLAPPKHMKLHLVVSADWQRALITMLDSQQMNIARFSVALASTLTRNYSARRADRQGAQTTSTYRCAGHGPEDELVHVKRGEDRAILNRQPICRVKVNIGGTDDTMSDCTGHRYRAPRHKARPNCTPCIELPTRKE